VGDSAEVIIVGGGVVGVCTAYFLARSGAGVLLVDKGELASGSSFGNAGLVVPSFCSPLADRRLLLQGLGFLLDRAGPFKIKPRPDLGLGGWLWRFVRACSRARYSQGVEVLLRLNREGTRVHQELAGLGGPEYEYRQAGLLSAFTTPKAFKEAGAEVLALGRKGMELSVLGRAEVHDLEPCLGPEVCGGILYRADASLQPAAFVNWLGAGFKEAGGRIMTGAEVYGFRREGGRVAAVLTTRGELKCRRLVIAAGAWQPGLTRLLGRRLPVEGAKGYSLTFDRPPERPLRPLILEERHIAVTPYAESLRVTGILDLEGLDLSIHPRRLGTILPQAGEYLPFLTGLEPVQVWRGLRPCSPDGLPLVGRMDPWPNVFVAVGHDTKGISLGPLTGLILSRIMAGEDLGSLGRALSPQRF